jgi:hypothetical protein
MVPNKIYSSQRYGDTAAVLRASLTSGRIAMPPVHKRMGFSDSAMAAAQVGRVAQNQSSAVNRSSIAVLGCFGFSRQ